MNIPIKQTTLTKKTTILIHQLPTKFSLILGIVVNCCQVMINHPLQVHRWILAATKAILHNQMLLLCHWYSHWEHSSLHIFWESSVTVVSFTERLVCLVLYIYYHPGEFATKIVFNFEFNINRSCQIYYFVTGAESSGRFWHSYSNIYYGAGGCCSQKHRIAGTAMASTFTKL